MTIDFSDDFSPRIERPSQPAHHSHHSHGLPLFNMGKLVATSNALGNLTPADITTALRRHLRGDWGELDEHDIQANERALKEEGRLLSVYRSTRGVKFYIITEADRTRTTVLLPEDY